MEVKECVLSDTKERGQTLGLWKRSDSDHKVLHQCVTFMIGIDLRDIHCWNSNGSM